METHEKEILYVWDFWNDSNIIKHRDLPKFSKVISGRLRLYSVSELCGAIRNYNDILRSERHWFSYRWTLDQFLSRKNALDCFIDREVALNTYSKKKTRFEDDETEDDGADFYRAISREEFNIPQEDK